MARSKLARGLLRAVAAPIAWVALFSFFLNLTYLASPLYMMQIYDRVLRSQSVPTLLSLTTAMALCYVVYAVLDGVRGQVLAGISERVEQRLARALMRSLTAAESNGRARPAATLIGRDLDTLRQCAAGPAVIAFVDLPWIPLYLAVITLLHWVLGAFALGAAILLLLLTLVAERAARAPMARAGLAAGEAYQFGDAIARYADCASTMGLGATLTARWTSLRRAMLEAQSEASRRAVVLAAISRFARLFFQSAMLGVGAWLAIRQQISAGAIFAGSLLLGRMLAPLEGVTASWRVTLAAREAFRRMRSIASPPAATAMLLPAPRGEVNLENVRWTPAGTDRPAVLGVTARIESGAILAVVGPSAAGKSTLMRLLAGALRPDAGIVRLDGADLLSWSPAQAGAAIGYLPQDVALFPGTVRDNIARFGPASDAAVVAAAHAARAHAAILSLPHGYQTRLDMSGAGLSGGQRQRIGLARALLGDPPVLLLDEPNAHLDAEGEAALIECVLAARRARRTVVMVTHKTSLVRIADFVATMQEGQMKRVQRAAEFLAGQVPAAVAGAGA